MKNITKLIAAAALAVSFTGCQMWKPLNAGAVEGENAYRFTVPSGWTQHTANKGRVMISKDWPTLNWVEFDKYSFAEAKKEMGANIDNDTVVTELASYYRSGYEKQLKMSNITETSLTPATVAGEPAFRMEFFFTNAEGVTFNVLAYGFVKDGNFYELLYQAPRVHYYQASVTEFEDMVASFELI